jgi:hypothetical protein
VDANSDHFQLDFSESLRMDANQFGEVISGTNIFTEPNCFNFSSRTCVAFDSDFAIATRSHLQSSGNLLGPAALSRSLSENLWRSVQRAAGS